MMPLAEASQGAGVQIVLPTNPATTGCVQEDRHLRHLCRQLLQCVADTLRVGSHGRRNTTVRVVQASGQVKFGKLSGSTTTTTMGRLDSYSFFEHLDEGICILVLVYSLMPSAQSPAISEIASHNEESGQCESNNKDGLEPK